MDTMVGFAGLLALAFLRYLPAVALGGLTPLRWAPPLVRILLALALAWLTVLALPFDATAQGAAPPAGWIVAALGELLIGLAFGLTLILPNAAIHGAGWLIDVQAGLSAGTLFDPGGQGDMQSMLGSALVLLATVLFFVFDLHLDLYRAMVASVRVIPLGQLGAGLDAGGFFGLLGSSFLLGLMIVAPVMLGLLVIDIGVAYATRSMPQANVYFLMLPLKILVALLLLAATLPFVPFMLERLYRDALQRLPGLLGS